MTCIKFHVKFEIATKYEETNNNSNNKNMSKLNNRIENVVAIGTVCHATMCEYIIMTELLTRKTYSDHIPITYVTTV